MKWKDIINKTNTKKYAVITKIKENICLNSTFEKFYKNNTVLFWICCIIILFFVVFTYKTNILKILVTLLIIAIIMIFGILKNTYSIKTEKEQLSIKMFGSEIIIPYDDLLNIYIQKETSLKNLVYHSYKIAIIFNKDNEQVILELPTEMLDKNDIIKFFKYIEFQQIEKQQQEEEKAMEEKKLTRKAILLTSIVFILAIILTSIIIFCITKNS